jgi:hypothetical protein
VGSPQQLISESFANLTNFFNAAGGSVASNILTVSAEGMLVCKTPLSNGDIWLRAVLQNNVSTSHIFVPSSNGPGGECLGAAVETNTNPVPLAYIDRYSGYSGWDGDNSSTPAVNNGTNFSIGLIVGITFERATGKFRFWTSTTLAAQPDSVTSWGGVTAGSGQTYDFSGVGTVGGVDFVDQGIYVGLGADSASSHPTFGALTAGDFLGGGGGAAPVDAPKLPNPMRPFQRIIGKAALALRTVRPPQQTASASSPVTLTPSAAVSTWVVPTPVLSAGAVTLAPTAPASSWVVPAPVLSAGGVTLSPAAATSAWVVPTAVLSVGPVTLSPTAATSSWTVPAPALSEGGVTLSPTAPSSTWIVPAPVLSVGPLTFSPTAPHATWNAGNATLTGGSQLTPSAAVSTWVVPTPTLSAGPLTLTPSAATSTWTANAPVLSVGPLTLAPSAPHASWVTPSPVLGAGPLSLAPLAATSAWNVPTPVLAVGPLTLGTTAAVAVWQVLAATFGPAVPLHLLDEPLFIDFDALATAIDFTALTTAIDFDSLKTMLVFLDGGTEVLKLTIIRGEVTPIAMTLRGADPATGELVPYNLTAATSVKLNAGMPGKTLIISAKDVDRTDNANGRVTYNPDPTETAIGGKYDALVVATFPGTPPIVRKFPGELTIKDAIA